MAIKDDHLTPLLQADRMHGEKAGSYQAAMNLQNQTIDDIFPPRK